MQIELSEKEMELLLELLQEHLYFGWIALEGEFDVVATGQVSPTLSELYGRIKQARQRDQVGAA